MMQANVSAKEKLNSLGALNGDNTDYLKEKFKYLNILFHGDGGMGKTTICTTACLDARTSPVFVCDFEGGAPLRFAKMPKGTYHLERIESVEDLNRVFEYLSTPGHPYKSVILDSLTEIQKLGLSEFVNTVGSVKLTFKQAAVNIKPAEIQHWGKSALQMGQIVRFFRDLPIHVFFTTLSQTVRDEVSGRISYTVALPGKQADEIPGIPDIVGYVYAAKGGPGQKVHRVIRFQPDNKIVAKDRTDALPEEMIFEKGEPIIPEILDMIWKEYGITANDLSK